MKKVLVVLMLLAAAFGWQHMVKRNQQAGATAPAPISDPIYAEVHVERSSVDRSIELVMLARTIDQNDCDQALKRIPQQLKLACADCALKSAECMPELPSRYGKLFNNAPTHVTYISIERGAEEERDMRLLTWGVSLEESNKLCDLVPLYKTKFKGSISCIRALN